MIYYFSSTGNCEYVARRIGDAIGDEVCSIAEVIHDGGVRLSGDSVGIIVPTYAWGLPAIVVDFLRQLLPGGKSPIFGSLQPTAAYRGRPGILQRSCWRQKDMILGQNSALKCRITGRRCLTSATVKKWRESMPPQSR